MRVLLVTGSYPPDRCGVGDHAERLAYALARYTDTEVDILTSAGMRSGAGEASARIHDEMTTWSRRDVPTFVKSIRRIRPHIVHIQFPTQGYVAAVDALPWIAVLSRFVFRIPVVLTWHEYVPENEPNIRRAMYYMALAANALIVVRQDYAARMPRDIRRALGKAPVTYVENVSNIPTARLTGGERETLRRQLLKGASRLVTYFGFIYAHKGAEQLFRIADHRRDHLLFVGDVSRTANDHAPVLAAARSPEWQGKVTVTGFVESEEAARLLSISDAVVFPHVGGGGIWNSSLHAAMCQGTFVITTSADRAGYDPATHIYYAAPGDVEGMKRALNEYAGTRNPVEASAEQKWQRFARAHRSVYQEVISVP
jgi:glycosyltransferase involved in cell wall biosynthesis